MMEWNGKAYTPAGGTSVRYGLEVALTDKDGKYRFSNFRLNTLRGTASLASVYKSGFHLIRIDFDASTQFLGAHSGTQDEKFKQISVGFRSNCEAESNPNKILPILKAIYEEKRANATTDDQLREVEERWLGEVEQCEFGSSTAFANAKKRQELRWKDAAKENKK